MKRHTAILWMMAAIAVCIQVAPAQSSGIITAKELAEMSGEENLRIVSTRNGEDYAKVHIKGAINVYHQDLYREGDLKGLLKDPEEIAQLLGSKGISETNTIVVYDGGDAKAAGRLCWILEYLGCKDVWLLDGQMPAWRKARKPVTKEATSFEPVTFTAVLDSSCIAFMDDVKKDGVLLVDVRSQAEFDGEKGSAARKGHIPGAMHFEYTNVLNEDDTLKSAEELQAAFAEAGISAEKDIILYCETSIRAGIVYVALDWVLHYPHVRVYDGALYEWAAASDTALE